MRGITYYVQSGAVTETVIAKTAKEAVRGAMMRAMEKEQVPGLLTSCNTIGYGVHPEDDMMFITENELIALGYSVDKFLTGFDLTQEQWIAYRKIKQAVEAFQGLLTDDDGL